METMSRSNLRHVIPLKDSQRDEAQIDEYPDTCPFCKNGGIPTFVAAHSLESPWEYNEFIEALFICPINNCKRYYLAYYGKYGRMDETFFLKKTGAPAYFKPIEFSEEIKKISEKFQHIYNQANIAEEDGLNQICGAGYRKALEFLIKDYLIQMNPKATEVIKKKPLGETIKDDIKSEYVQTCAKRAIWLGNDETHYIKIFQNKDTQDLKELIKLTIFWIESELATNKYREEMPEKRKEQKKQKKLG